jgi:hypothetical protein
MAQTEFRSQVENGVIDESAITISMIADDTSIALYGPVVLADGSVTELPHAASTTTAGDANVIGVCVRLPRNGTITADTSHVEVCIYGITKLKVNDANVSLNDALETNSTAGEARVQAGVEISTVYDKADEVAAFNNIRKCFARALTTVSSGADSYIAAFVNIQPGIATVTAEA